MTGGSDIERLRSEQSNVAHLLLVLESNLALMSSGESYDGELLVDAVGYLVDYVGRFHRAHVAGFADAVAREGPAVVAGLAALTTQYESFQAAGAELLARLVRASRDEPLERGELVRLGFDYCTQLRRSMSLEQSALDAADATLDDATVGAVPLVRAASDEEQGYRARFEELAQRSGCDCDYESTRDERDAASVR